ncbi:hypothetical protein [Flavobacterium sp. ZS1P14]|uniref:hypothetical protein n=1 Tax=Flavobacterium sp. ZS1P14 TaxID=3401729 RepID=UPI003AAED0BD
MNLYFCDIKILDCDINTQYDWNEDVINENWNSKNAKTKLKEIPNKMVCDALLEQHIFSGIGNITKNKILYHLYIHPESVIGKIPEASGCYDGLKETDINLNQGAESTINYLVARLTVKKTFQKTRKHYKTIENQTELYLKLNKQKSICIVYLCYKNS